MGAYEVTQTVANVDAAAAWEREGEDWARDWERYDRAVEPYERLLLDTAAIGPGERVLDVGCGTGQTTRHAARTALEGSALGVDLSSAMLARARQLAHDEGLANARFERADAQVQSFERAGHDVVLSRFGTMFFGDPTAAFANLRATLRPGGRLVMVAWRAAEDNEWLRLLFAVLSPGQDLPVPPPGAPGPFGLADVERTRQVLEGAGFDAVETTAVDAPFWLGSDPEDASAFLRTTGMFRGLTDGLDEEQQACALERLRWALVEHQGGDGVELGSGGWLVSAR